MAIQRPANREKQSPANRVNTDPKAALDDRKNFLQAVVLEMKKTTWPTRPEVIRLTYVVIGILISVGLYMFVLDNVLTWLFSRL